MTIAKGVQWGEPGAMPAGSPVADSDVELARLVQEAVLAGSTPDPLGLSGGDLFATLGGPGTRHPTDPEAWRSPIDALVVRFSRAEAALEPERVVAVAHVVAFSGSGSRMVRRRRRASLSDMAWFEAETMVVANASFAGAWNIAPRGHPNDGRAEVTRGCLPKRDRRQLSSRLRTGTHLPHPDLATSRPKTVESGPGPWRLFIDGADRGIVESFAVEVVPDAFIVVR